MSAPALVDGFDAVLLDLDGVVYRGHRAVPGAVAAIEGVRRRGTSIAFVTNNAARTPDEIADHLRSLGIAASAEEVVTSPQAAMPLVLHAVPEGSRVLVVGGPGLHAEVRSRGFEVVDAAAAHPAAVVQGFGPDVCWRDLAEAAFAVRAGAAWIATNLDLSIPIDGGIAPGNGALVAAVAAAAGREPDAVAGKPEPALFEEACRRIGARRPLVVGDRLDTDIEAGSRAGLATLLVLTGVSTLPEALAARGSRQPVFIADDLQGLLAPAVPLREWQESRAHGTRGAGSVPLEEA